MNLTEGAVSVSIGKQILKTETNDGRFENFCRDAVSTAEGGAKILGTSASWDLGRDGVGYGRASGIYVCVSLRDDVDAKALADIARIQDTTRDIKLLYFCSSHELSEHKRTALEGQLSEEVEHAFPCRVLGGAQLVELALADGSILPKYYGAETEDCLRALSEQQDEHSENRGLKLALMAIGEDSATVRAHVYQGVILEILQHGAHTIEGLAKKISDRLRLMRNLAKEALIAPLHELGDAGLVSTAGSLYSITEHGKSELVSSLENATDALLSGRAVVRKAIEDAIGGKLADDHYNKIWAVFEERMVGYCISRGETLVAEVSQLLGTRGAEGRTVPEQQSFSFVDELAAAVGATSTSSQLRLELAQAVRDIFIERTGPATDWLVHLCMGFMTACSLGLEFTCGGVIEQILKRTHLVLDTDVVLSLIGEGEVDHIGVVAIAQRWKSMGGRILVGEPVLEEVAYHAWIAALDYEQVQSWLPGTLDDRQHIIGNVFVRSFAELLSKGKAKKQHWSGYIRQYRGEREYDWTPIYRQLNVEYGIEKLPPRSSGEEGLERRVKDFLIQKRQGTALTANTIRNMQDKARRDAQLYSAIVSFIRSIRTFDPQTTCLLLSSAKRLANAESNFRETAEPELVTSISTALHLLSLAPNVRLGTAALKAFLFDERPVGFSGDFERTLMRMLKASDQVSIPWAKRATLMKAVRDKMMEDAKTRGLRPKPEELEQVAFNAQNQGRTIQLLTAALDAAAIDSKLAKENADLRRRNAELEEIARKLRERNAHPPKKK